MTGRPAQQTRPDHGTEQNQDVGFREWRGTALLGGRPCPVSKLGKQFFDTGVAFITMYLPPYLTNIGAGARIAAWAIAAIGLFNVVGAYTASVLGHAHSKRLLLSTICVARAIVIATFLLLPKTPIVILLFAAAMGLLWLSTVPLTSGLVAVMFGNRYLGTLFGVVFFSHQLGAFAAPAPSSP